jgi:hypothetical protein
MQPFLALITPIGGGPQGPVDPSFGVPGWPSHPMAPGGPPPGIWGGGNMPYPDQSLPRPQPGQPPRPWGPINYPDQGLPGQQPPPLGFWGGSSPGVGPQPRPDQGLPGNQPYPDQSLPGMQPHPSHPIFIPPPDYQNPPEGGKPPPPEGGWGYSPQFGWGYFPPENVAKPKKGQQPGQQGQPGQPGQPGQQQSKK